MKTLRHVLVTYDVSTETKAGRTRLRRVAKICESYGQRVQNSVFECLVDNKIFTILENRLLKVINEDEDSLRIYSLVEPFEDNLKQYGKNRSFNFQDPIVL